MKDALAQEINAYSQSKENITNISKEDKEKVKRKMFMSRNNLQLK